MNSSSGNAELPTGFDYYPDFLSEDEEIQLVSFIQTLDLHPFMFQGFEAKRKVQSFGYDYNFDGRKLKEGKPIPADFLPLIKKVAEKIQVSPDDFKEVLVTEYPADAVINWHRDAPPFRLIAGISLLSGCRFRLRPMDKAMQSRQSLINLPMGRRSLYVIDGEARDSWQHSIAAVRQLRYSITLRTLA